MKVFKNYKQKRKIDSLIKKGIVKIENRRLLKNTYFRINGINNKIVVEKGTKLFNCVFEINGDNNLIFLKENCSFRSVSFLIEDNNNSILIDSNCFFAGLCEISAIEGTKIAIGKNCLFSKNITIATGDGHSVVNLKGERLNHSRNISIKNHVWVGANVDISKGTTIREDSIIGRSSFVNKEFKEKNIIIAGIPARIVKKSISWIDKRFSC